jgi:hypothetical protein
MQISRVRLALICGQFMKTPSPYVSRGQSRPAKPERQKAAKDGNELAAFCRLWSLAVVAICRNLPLPVQRN